MSVQSCRRVPQAGTNATPSQKPRTRVFIVDDHPLIRYALKAVVTAQTDMEICGESEDGRTALGSILGLRPDLALIDVSVNGYSGIELVKAIRVAEPGIRIIMISMHAESVYGLRALEAGAHGYCMKSETSDRLLAAIRRVCAGGISVSDSLAQNMVRRLSSGRLANDTSPFASFSDRELEIVELIGRGTTTQQIAVKLGISVKTVETHRAHIKEKLGVENATQLVQSCTRLAMELSNAAWRTGREPAPNRIDSPVPLPPLREMKIAGRPGSRQAGSRCTTTVDARAV